MAFATGDIVGGCEIVARLKAGGMATLYLARREGVSGFSRRVAIKVVHDHLAEDEEFVRMFVDEALLSSRISHPNVVHVEELGRESDQHFLVMEYVHGCSLSQLLKELARRDRALPYELSVSIAMQVLAGLHAAHEVKDEAGRAAGVVHRDVSPDNVLLSYDGHVKLIDFGIAKAQDRATQTSGQLKGKLRYMSPEQAKGGNVDRRTDLYALSVVLWEMLTMRRLFTAGDQMKLLDLVRNPAVPAPRSIRADVPPAVEEVVMRALSPEVSGRMPTALEMRRELAQACPGALLADASKLADLLTVAMSEQRAKSEAKMSSGSMKLEPPAPVEDGALRTMTISMTGIEFLGAADPSRPSSARASVPSAPSTYAPAETAAAEASKPTRSGSGKMLAVAAVVAVGLVAGVALGITASLPSDDDAPIRATPLDPRAPTDVEAPPPEVVAPTPIESPEPAEAEPAPTEVQPPEVQPPETPPAETPPAEAPPPETQPPETPPAVARRARRQRRVRPPLPPPPPVEPATRRAARRSADLPLADEF